MNLPEYLFGVGGAGRAIVRTLLTEEWVVQEAIENDQSIDAYFIDTDTDDGPADDEDPITDTVDDVKEDLGIEDDNVGIKARHINLIESVEKTPTNSRILNEDNVRDIAQGQNLNAWWLEDDTDLLRSESNYSEGVVRRRGLTKGLYHYSRNDAEDPIGGMYRSVNGDRGAIVVGLGGGSGAGLFIDMAKELSDELNLTLFAVLPDTEGGDDDDAEFANAYASLVELERLALTEQNPFKNIVLLPKSPATNNINFDKAIGYSIAGFYNATADASNVLEYYDEAANQGVKKFAPFTLAAPQVLTYPGGTREETRDNLRTFVEDRTELLDTEEELLEEAEAFVRDYYEAVQSALLDENGTADSSLDGELYGETTGLYDGRVKALRNLLEAEFMDQQNFSTVDDALNLWDELRTGNTEDGEEPASAEERQEMIEELGTETFGTEGASKEVERKLIELIDRESELVGKRAALRKAVKDIPHPVVSDDLNDALGYDTSGVNADSSDVRDHIADLRRWTNETSSAVTEIVEDAESERDDRLARLEDEVETIVEEFVDLKGLESAIEEELTDLETALENLKRNAEGWEDAAEAKNARLDFSDERLRDLEEMLSKVGVSGFDRGDVQNSVSNLMRAGELELKDGGLLGRFTGNGSGEYQEARNRIDNRLFEIGSYGGGFYPSYERRYLADVRAELRERAETLESRLTETATTPATTASEAHELTPDDVLGRVATQVEEYETKREEWAREVSHEIGLDETEGPFGAFGVDGSLRPDEPETPSVDIETTITTVVNEIASNATAETYDDRDGMNELRSAVHDALTELLVAPAAEVQQGYQSFGNEELNDAEKKFTDLDNLVEKGGDFNGAWDEEGPIKPSSIPERPDGLDSGADGHVETLMPKEPGRLDAEDVADAGMWDDDAEKKKLIGTMESRFDETVFDRTRGGSHLPIEAWTIQSGGNQTFSQSDYEVPRMRQVHLSRAFRATSDRTHVSDDGAVIDDLEELIGGAIDAERHKHMQVAAGDEWDFATVLFVGGVFLDNLSPVQNQYLNSYESLLGKEIEISDPTGRFDEPRTIDAGVIRHALGLDGTTEDVPDDADGVYYTRERFLNFNRDTDLAALLDHPDESWGDDVREALLADYYTETGFPSTRPIDYGE